MGELLTKILKNTRATAAVGAIVCGLIAAGAYKPTGDVEAALTTFVAVGAGGAVGAVVAFVVATVTGRTDEAAK